MIHNSVGDVLMTLFMLVLFPVLIPFMFFVAVYWIACGLLSSDNYKKEVDE